MTMDGAGSDPTTETVCRYPCGPTISATDTVREAASHSVANRTYAVSVMAPVPAAVMPTFDDGYRQCMTGFARLRGDAFGDWCPGYQRPAHPAADLTIDHVEPLAAGGAPFDIGNTAVLCRSCNSTNGASVERVGLGADPGARCQ
jgi:hypothetical protein